MEKHSDKEYWQLIWEKFKAGDCRAFEIIYNEFVDTLYAYGSKITSNRSLLEDAIQDLFIDVYTYGKSLRQPEYLEFYLFKTLKRIIIRKLKESKRMISVSDNLRTLDLKFPIEDIEEEKLLEENQIFLLQQEIKNLDNKKREILFLKFNSGLSYVEIGKILGLKPGTVKKQVYRIITYFRDKIS